MRGTIQAHMDVFPRRRSIWKVLRILLGVAAALLGAVGIFFGHAFYRARLRLEERLLAVTRTLETFPPDTLSRPAIFDPEEDGNAWDFEDRAIWNLEGNGKRDLKGHMCWRWGYGDHTGGLSSDFYDPETVALTLEGSTDLLRHALRRREVLPGHRPYSDVGEAVVRLAHDLIAASRKLHREGKDLPAAERLVLALGLAQDVARHGDYSHLRSLFGIEYLTSKVAQEILSAHSLSDAELRTWATWMDRLGAGRPDLGKTIAADSALLEKDVLEDFDNVLYVYSASPLPVVQGTWRDLWSDTIAKHREIFRIEERTRSLAARLCLPPWRRGRENLSEVDYCDIPSAALFEVDAASLLHRLLWRVSIALASYEAEQGTPPGSLSQLIPRYLPEMPLSPRTGRILEYETSTLRADPGAGDVMSVVERDSPYPNLVQWKVGRKTR
jgi:hypothetical protein